MDGSTPVGGVPGADPPDQWDESVPPMENYRKVHLDDPAERLFRCAAVRIGPIQHMTVVNRHRLPAGRSFLQVRISGRWARMIPKLVFAAFAVIVIVALPSLAHADPADDYIAELQRGGIDYSTPTAAINLGKASCQALQGDANLMAVIKTIEDNEGYTSRDTGIIIRAAANAFCPDQLSTVEGFIEDHGG